MAECSPMSDEYATTIFIEVESPPQTERPGSGVISDAIARTVVRSALCMITASEEVEATLLPVSFTVALTSEAVATISRYRVDVGSSFLARHRPQFCHLISEATDRKNRGRRVPAEPEAESDIVDLPVEYFLSLRGLGANAYLFRDDLLLESIATDAT